MRLPANFVRFGRASGGGMPIIDNSQWAYHGWFRIT